MDEHDREDRDSMADKASRERMLRAVKGCDSAGGEAASRYGIGAMRRNNPHRDAWDPRSGAC